MSSPLNRSLIPLCSLFLLAAACGSTSTAGDAGPDAGSNDGGTRDGGTNDGGSMDAGPMGDGGAPPGAPILSFTTSQTGVQLTWTLPGAFGDERFQVLRSDQGSGFVQVTGANSVAADAYSDGIASALPGAGHKYEVTATNGNGTGPASNVVEVLQAPGDLAAGGSDTRVLLVWGALQNASSYDVYRVPAADAGGSSQLLGNVTNAEYVDDGSAQPITAGQTYQYQLIAHSIDGGQPSTGSNVAAAEALGIDVTLNVTHVSDLIDAGVTQADTTPGYAPNAIIGTDAGTLQWLPAFSTSTALVIPRVPEGPYAAALAVPGTQGNYVYFAATTARSLDMSSVAAGRIDRVYPQNLTSQTTLTYALTGLNAWAEPDGGPDDTLQSVSVGAGNSVVGVELELDDGGIDAGAVTFSGVESIDGRDGNLYLVDSTQGDIYYLSQLHSLTTSKGIAYQSVTKAYSDSSLHMTDGANSAIAGALSAPAITTIPDLVVANSAFSAQSTGVNPASTNAGQTVSIFAEKDFSAYGAYGAPTLLATVSIPGATSGNVDVGSLVYGNPFPASWQPFVEVTYGFNQTFDLAGDSGSATFEAESGFYQPVAGFNWATGVAPTLAPMTNVKINGTLDAFADETNTGLTPTFSWTPPTTLGTPNTYVVSIYELSLDANGDVAIGNAGTPYPPQDFSFTTTATSFTLPAGVLTAEDSTASHWYFVTIDAQLTTNGTTPINQSATPYQAGTNYNVVQIISNKFTPGPGTSTPSGYGSLVRAGARVRPSALVRRAGLLPPRPMLTRQ